MESMIVYGYAFVLAALATWPIPGVPFKGGAYGGLACGPKSYDSEYIYIIRFGYYYCMSLFVQTSKALYRSYTDRMCFTDASTFFFWFAYVPLFMLIPLAYVLWSCGHILYHGMVPPVGRRRNLALYFFRLIFVFVFMWLPFILITFVVNPAIPGPQNPWVLFAGAAWSHLQGLVSVAVSCTKGDIRDCLLDTVTCGYYVKKKGRENDNQPTNITSWNRTSVETDHEKQQPAEDEESAALQSYSIMKSFNNFSGAISRMGSSIKSERRSSSTMTTSGNMASMELGGTGVNNPVTEEEIDDFRENEGSDSLVN